MTDRKVYTFPHSPGVEWVEFDPKVRMPDPTPAPCKIGFIIIGASISGLAATIALTRVGHRVIVLEADSPTAKKDTSFGSRMAPNATKLLNKWGLKPRVSRFSIRSDAITMLDFATSEAIGIQVWNEEMLSEARGEFEFVNHYDLLCLLQEVALESGAEIRYETRVSSVNPDDGTVVLESGEELSADVIVGADGPNGVTRPLIADASEIDKPGTLAMYNTTVSNRDIVNDPELSSLYDNDVCHMYSWFGNGYAAHGFPIGSGEEGEFALHMYAPYTGNGGWKDIVDKSELDGFANAAEVRLSKLVGLAKDPVRVPCNHFADHQQWVHPSGKMVLIGDAAHQMTPGGLQSLAMGIEDGAVLARIFSHLPQEDRISNFLFAFHEIRQDRVKDVRDTEASNLAFLTMPPGEIQICRDRIMRRKMAEGKNALDPESDVEVDTNENNRNRENPNHAEWMKIMRIFCYDAEDEADEWWVKWGLLRERAAGAKIPLLPMSMGAIDPCEDTPTICPPPPPPPVRYAFPRVPSPEPAYNSDSEYDSDISEGEHTDTP